MNFLFWLFLTGIVVASLQDINRREVDNWLNLFLLMASFAYLFFTKEANILLNAAILLFIMYFVSNLFFYGRVFAGGDTKLLFSMTAFFLGATITYSIINAFLFILILMISGSIYGLIYSGAIYFKNFKKVNKKLSNSKKLSWKKYFIILAAILLAIGFYNWVFFILAAVFFVFPYLFSFAKALEDSVMTKEIKAKNLREGDWLAEDLKIGKKLIYSKWEGLTKAEIQKIQKSKKRKIKIKEGLPFIPAFLIAFLVYYFLKESVFSYLV